MSTIRFDHTAADTLLSVLDQAEQRIDRQGRERASAVDIAMDDFAGGYSRVFEDGADIEQRDRAELIENLDSLAQQIREAQRAAEEEQQRLEATAQWEQRYAAWQAHPPSGGPEASLSRIAHAHEYVSLMFTRPAQNPVPTPRITAAFTARNRPRTAGGNPDAVSSAIPGRLRSFVSIAQACNRIVAEELNSFRSAWSLFRGSCSWVGIDTFTLLQGFADYFDQGEFDARWIDYIADAFEVAGTGELTSHVLDSLALSVHAAAMTDQQLLKALATLDTAKVESLFATSPALANQLQLIDPQAINTWWNNLTITAGQQDKLVEALPEVIGNLEGIPYVVRGDANNRVLTRRLTELAQEIEELDAQLFGSEEGLVNTPRIFQPAPDPMLLARLRDLDDQRSVLKEIQLSLASEPGQQPRSLISLSADHPPLAAVAIGNLDTAENVTFSVAGMTSSTEKMTDWTNATNNIHLTTHGTDKNAATVAWLGYEAPAAPPGDWGVFGNEKAQAGGDNLAKAFKGFDAVRQDDDPQLNGVAHSYGTTAMAFALSQAGVHVDNVIFAGSAGLPDHLSRANDLNADNVYAGHARDVLPYEFADGDQWAWMGRDFSDDHGVNPMDEDFGATTFGTDSKTDGAGNPVTTHSALDSQDGTGYYDMGSEALINIGRALRNEADKMSTHVDHGPTLYQQHMIGGSSY